MRASLSIHVKVFSTYHCCGFSKRIFPVVAIAYVPKLQFFCLFSFLNSELVSLRLKLATPYWDAEYPNMITPVLLVSEIRRLFCFFEKILKTRKYFKNFELFNSVVERCQGTPRGHKFCLQRFVCCHVSLWICKYNC